MEEINFALIADQLLSILAPIIGTIVTTIMGTEAFKWITVKTGLNISSRQVTWIVWGLVAVIVWLVLQWFPWWFIIILGLLAAGGYSWWIKPILQKIGIARRDDERQPPIGGGGGGPVIK